MMSSQKRLDIYPSLSPRMETASTFRPYAYIFTIFILPKKFRKNEKRPTHPSKNVYEAGVNQKSFYSTGLDIL